MGPLRHCKGCKKKFTPKGEEVICSEKCPSILISKKCYTCGVEFFRPRSTGSRIKFCSQYCRIQNGAVSSRKERSQAFKESRKREFTRWVGKRRHHKIASGHKIDSRTVFDLFEWTCILCNQKIPKDVPSNHPDSVSLEHVIPLSVRGGSHTWFNVGPAHTRCNRDKNDSVDHNLIDKVFNLWLNV